MIRLSYTFKLLLTSNHRTTIVLPIQDIQVSNNHRRRGGDVTLPYVPQSLTVDDESFAEVEFFEREVAENVSVSRNLYYPLPWRCLRSKSL